MAAVVTRDPQRFGYIVCDGAHEILLHETLIAVVAERGEEALKQLFADAKRAAEWKAEVTRS